MALIRLAFAVFYHVWQRPARRPRAGWLSTATHNIREGVMVFPEHSGTAAGSRHGRNLEGAMSLSTEHEMPQLPKRLPAGSVYVVEGRVGRHGNLRVSSRYLVMPSGEKVKFPMELAAKHPVGAGSRRLFGRDSRPSSRTKEFSRGTKKFAVLRGTRRQRTR
jgi:hypothetical protein